MYAVRTMDCDNCGRRSTPIEIPWRRRPVSAYSPQFPAEQSQSPDMIFEMSPITSNYPSSPSISPPPPPRNSYDREPFLYPFPVLKNCNVNTPSCLHTPIRRHEIVPVSHTIAFTTKPGHRRRRRAAESEPNENNPSFPYTYNGTMDARKSTTTRIVGFSPTLPSSCGQRNSTQVSSTQECRPLASGRSAFPWSPWILPGQSNIQGEDILSVDGGPGAIGFEEYLLNRTESTHRLFNGLNLVSSVL